MTMQPGDVKSKSLSIHEAIPYFQRGAALLDTRPKADYAQRHVPGSVHLEADDQLSSRIGSVLPPDMPLVLLVADENTYRRVVDDLTHVGYERVVGYLAESLDTWEAMGLPVTSGDIRDIAPAELHRLLELPEAERPLVIDVREPWEYQRGHVPGARLIPLGDLGHHLDELDPARPVALICESGSRSQSAAALLGRKGFATVYNVVGGTMAWMMDRLPLERSNGKEPLS